MTKTLLFLILMSTFPPLFSMLFVDMDPDDLMLHIKFHESIQKNKIAEVRALLDKNANVNAQNSEGNTALMLAADRRLPQMCKLLLVAGAKVNAIDSYDRTPLANAVINETANICQILIAAHAQVNTTDKRQQTPLHHAAKGNSETICSLLLAKGANPCAKDEKGMTPLMLATDIKIDGETQNICQALIAKPLFLPRPSAAALHESQQKIISALCIFKRAHLPRDVQYIILNAHDELNAHVRNCPFKIHAHHYEHIAYIPLTIIRLLIRNSHLQAEKTIYTMKQHCLNCIAPLIKEAHDYGFGQDLAYNEPESFEIKTMLNPDIEAIKTNHGKQIEENIKKAIL